MVYNEEHKHFKSYKIRIHIHITELVKRDRIIIAVEIGTNGEIKSGT
jgi:hypothetical protein